MATTPRTPPPAASIERWSTEHGTPRRRVLLFPHAGGGGLAGRALQRAGTEVLVHRRPGRESRMGDSSPVSVSGAVAEALAALLPVLEADDVPTVVLGHSFGALCAAEFAAAVESRHPARLEHVVLSAKPAPPDRDPDLAQIVEDDGALAAWLLDLGGTPEELLSDPGLREMVLAPLRVDLRASLAHDRTPPRLGSPLLLVHAHEDRGATAQSMAGWAHSATGTVRGLEVPGGHHGLYEHPGLLYAALDAAALDDAAQGQGDDPAAGLPEGTR